ncbi:unnamed protein product [Allacma fusca]|uniref:Uncharacterized protein n=1 Tax=Allacma fusca TaxID=39272 RepID=A0A8J2LB12_9HEXA|nr:unnamed protein product [Allacma fusca]
METAESIIKRENLRNFKSAKEKKTSTTGIFVNDCDYPRGRSTREPNQHPSKNNDLKISKSKLPQKKDDSFHYYMCNGKEKILDDDYFLRRSTLPFQSIDSEVTQMSSIFLETKNESATEPCQTQTLNAVSTGLQEKITKALEDFNGSIHAIVPLVSVDENRQSVGADIASGVFNYCTKMAHTTSMPFRRKGKIQTAAKKCRQTVKMGDGSIRYQESQTQVLSSIQNRILIGRSTRIREATFVKKDMGPIVHAMNYDNNGNQELKSSQSVPQVLININNPFTSSSDGSKLAKNNVRVASTPMENMSAIFVNQSSPGNPIKKMSFQISVVTYSLIFHKCN